LAIIAVLVILLFSILLLPRPSGEGVKLERVFSIEQRIDSWKLAITMFKDHPLLGVGFNTIRFAKREYGLPQDSWRESHSGAGFENSYLFVGATAGIIGFIAYIFFLWQCFRNSGLFTRISLVAIMVHSFFLNTLFFPWVMLWMWVLLGIRDYKSPFFRQ
jgi:O-antigen ligase